MDATDATKAAATVGSAVTGVTTIATMADGTGAVGLGDYLIVSLAETHPDDETSKGNVDLVSKISGVIWSAKSADKEQKTVCSYSTPFKVGVHFDDDEAIAGGALTGITEAMMNQQRVENGAVSAGSGQGYQGFYLRYWQNSC